MVELKFCVYGNIVIRQKYNFLDVFLSLVFVILLEPHEKSSEWAT